MIGSGLGLLRGSMGLRWFGEMRVTEGLTTTSNILKLDDGT